jgi:hypothetical protein
LKSRASRKGGDERKKKSQRKCYECGEKEAMDTLLPSVPRTRTRMSKRRNTRRRSRNARTST